MNKPPLRRLNLSDLVILVVASAVGVLILRTDHEARAANVISPWVVPWSWQIGREVTPFLISTAAGLLVARFLQPRPPWRRLFRQPSVIACLVIITDVAVRVILRYCSWLIGSSGAAYTFYTFDLIFSGWMFSGRDVALACTILALVRAWRAEPSWIDRAGRTLGWLAIVIWLAAALLV